MHGRRSAMRNGTDVFLDHFSAIAAGPGGVDRLRELVLELAIRGELIPQESEDVVYLPNLHPPSQKGKKDRMIENIRTPSDSINHLSTFEIPDTWRLVEFERVLAEIKPGFAAGKRDPNGVVQLRMNNVNTRGGFNWNKIIRIPVEEVKNIEDYYLVQGDILFNNTNSSELVGKSAVFESFTEPIVYSNHFTRLRPKVESVASRFIGLWLNYLWNSRVFYDLCNKWIGQSAVNRDKLTKLVFPLPPLSEQYRIVEKVDRLMALCNNLEARQQAEREDRRRLRTASLAALEEAATAEEAERAWAHVAREFGRLVQTLEDVVELRKLVLIIAVRLASSAVIENIKQLPLSECGEWLGGLTPSKQQADYWDDESIPWFSPKDMKRTELDDAQDHITHRALEVTSLKLLPPGSVLFVVRGMILAHTFPVAMTTRSATINQDIRAIIPTAEIYDRYLVTMLKGCEREILALVKTSTHGTKKLDSPELKQWIIPVPSLAEQHCIVEKVDRMTVLCDGLEAGIRARDAALEVFAAAACRAVLGGPASAAAPAAVMGTGQQRLPV